MKLIEYFDAFLKDEVNLNDTRLALLDQRVEAITNFLRECAVFKNNYIDIIPQGSYAHKTIIRPVRQGDEFDADVLLYLTEFDGWSATDYVEKLYRAFRDNTTYSAMVDRKKRCVTVDYANDFHIDVVPYLERHSLKYVTNRIDNSFERTDPEVYNAWLDEKNRTAGRHLVKVIRLIKYLRDFKHTFAIKSVVLNVLLAEQVNDATLLLDKDYYHDVPTTLRNIMKHLREYVEARPMLPSIMDPSNTGENLSDRWHQDGYANFRNWIIYYSKKIDLAYAESDKSRSLALWQEVFGLTFQAPKNLTKAAEISRFSSPALPAFRNTEEQLDDKGIRLAVNHRFKVRLDGRVVDKQGFRAYDLAKYGNQVKSGRTIRFTVGKCTVPGNYQVYWKVKNNGIDAQKRDCIRGQIFEGSNTHLEPTSFRGSHYVECYIVQNGVCVASDRQEVTIT